MSSAVDILAVDDDKISQKMIRRALESAGYTPRPAFNGEEGIKEALRSVPDIILLDVEMPGLSGYEVCDQLRQQEPTKKTPIVFLSSHSSLRERMQGYEVGADDYLVKPFEPKTLTARVKVLLRFRDQERELEEKYALAKETALIAMAGTSDIGMGEDQETYVLNRIDVAIEDAIERIDASDALRDTFLVLLPNMRDIVRQQQELVTAFTELHTSEQNELQIDTSSDIELF